MALGFIIGGSGSGKTYKCYEEIIEYSLKDGKKNLILLVPEQFTLQTQKDIVRQHPNNGIINIEVLSFQRLAYRVFDEVGGTTKKVLEETGKSMVIRKVLESCKGSLQIFNKNIDKIGVIQEIKSSITEFYQYDISNEQLEHLIMKLETNPLLQTKLKDLSIIYSGFKDFLQDHYITTEEILDLLSEVVSRSNFIKESAIWIDGFTGFTPIQYKVLYEFIKTSEDVKVTITLDGKENLEDLNKYQLFYTSKKTYHQLTNLATEANVPITGIEWIQDSVPVRFKSQKSLAHLEQQLFRYPYKTYEDVPKGLEVFVGDHLSNEIEFVAKKITELVRDHQYRYQEVAVVTGDLQRYELFIEKVFRHYSIPYFIDQKKTILSNPVIELIRSTFDIFNSYWSYESVFGWLKTGLCQVELKEIDLLENYAMAYGIKGKKRWTSTWDKPYPSSHKEEVPVIGIEQLESVKHQAIKPLLDFIEVVQGKKHTVKHITIAFYKFLQQLEVEKQVEQYVYKFKQEGNLLLERQYQQIFKLVIDVLDKIVEILGDEEVSIKEYAVILEAGFEQAQMGLVPPGLDQVVVGDIERTRLKDIKTLFLIGANEGVLPKASIKGAIMTDRDRELLGEQGVALAPPAKERSFEEQFNLYLSLTKPQQKLYISLSKLDASYKTLRPSSLLNQIMKLYPDLKMVYEHQQGSIENIALPKSTVKYLVNEMRQLRIKDMDVLWKEVYSWYYKDPQWKEKVKLLIQGLFHQNKAYQLSSETAKRLYGNHLMNSVSRLEQYASCPFSHFIKYGLKVTERMQYELSVPDIGILFHNAIEEFSKKIGNRNMEWTDLTEELIEELVEESVREVALNYGNHIFFSSAKNEYLITRVIRIVKRTVWALQKHISSGAFRPVDYEVSFSSKDEALDALKIQFSEEHSLQLTGRIDRIDKYETEDKVYLKVLDYKSGQKSFDMVAVYYGLQLQLLVYLNAALEIEKKKNPTKEVVPAGVFYYRIDDPMIVAEKPLTDEEREEEILNKLKMDGLVLEDLNVIQLLDNSFDKQSKIIPVKFKKDGGFAAGSSVASYDKFQDLKGFIDHKLYTIGDELIHGHVEIKPYAYKNKKACDYCPYASVCQFDSMLSDNDYHQLKPMSEEGLWEAIQNAIQKKDSK
jgi:ATP-dependent helicase/nuclease subunit B